MTTDNVSLLDFCTTDNQRVCMQAYIDAGYSATGAAKVLGVDGANMRRLVRTVTNRAARQGYSPEHDMVRPVPDGFMLRGTSTLYDSDGVQRLQWVKSQVDRDRQIELMREAIEAMCEDLPKVKPRKAKGVYNDDLMAVIPMGDPHFGLYCWAEEVGEDFDLKIARRDLCAAIDYLVRQAPRTKRCVIVNLGDFFHADNYEGITTKSGNILDVDSRLPKMIRVGVAALRQGIESALEHHETVEVVNAIGNHDDSLSPALSIMLANIYENEPRIVIHDQPTRRHYLQHGSVLIGITHGHQTKDRELPGIMAAERPEQWGQTKYRYWYRGHHHHDERMEYNGCQVEQFRTLAPGDAYAVNHGYLAGRDMKCIIHHAAYGEIARNTCSIDMLRDDLNRRKPV